MGKIDTSKLGKNQKAVLQLLQNGWFLSVVQDLGKNETLEYLTDADKCDEIVIPGQNTVKTLMDRGLLKMKLVYSCCSPAVDCYEIRIRKKAKAQIKNLLNH